MPPSPSKRPASPISRRDRDWNNGLLLIAGIVGLPVVVAAIVALMWG